MATKKGFREGVKETKEMLAREFLSIPHGMFRGDEIAAFILKVEGPKPEEPETAKP